MAFSKVMKRTPAAENLTIHHADTIFHNHKQRNANPKKGYDLSEAISSAISNGTKATSNINPGASSNHGKQSNKEERIHKNII